MIYDCFTFFNEFDILELRLSILENAVDYFVIAEAPFTFRGTPKPLYLRDNMERFERWRHKIILLTYDKPASDNPWNNEWGQRDFLQTGTAQAAPDDLILIGDCDEIPDPRNVSRAPHEFPILGHDQLLSRGYVNRVATDRWIGTRTIRAGDVAAYATFSQVRRQALTDVEIVTGGWHFTSLGGAEVQSLKLAAFSHTELDTRYERDTLRLESQFANADDDVRWVPIDDEFPDVIRDDPRWAGFIWPKPASGAWRAEDVQHAHGCFAYVPAGATAVAVIAADPDVWQSTGSTRFGERFAGVYASAAELGARVGPGACVVIMEPESHARDTFARLRENEVTIVAFARNARSYRVFAGLMEGGKFPPGRALGLAEYRAWFRAAGYRVAAYDRIPTSEIFVPWASLPPTLTLRIGTIGFPDVPLEPFRTFMSHAFIFEAVPAPPEQGRE